MFISVIAIFKSYHHILTLVFLVLLICVCVFFLILYCITVTRKEKKI